MGSNYKNNITSQFNETADNPNYNQAYQNFQSNDQLSQKLQPPEVKPTGELAEKLAQRDQMIANSQNYSETPFEAPQNLTPDNRTEAELSVQKQNVSDLKDPSMDQISSTKTEITPKLTPIESVSESPEVSTSEKFLDSGSLMAGAVAQQVNSSLSNFQNSQIENNARSGLGPNGHAMDARMNAQMLEKTNDMFSAARNAELAVGSLGGPVGLAVGAGAALLTQNFSQSQDYATTNATAGGQINAATVAQ